MMDTFKAIVMAVMIMAMVTCALVPGQKSNEATRTPITIDDIDCQ